MADKWHDINAPGVWRKPNTDKPVPESNKPSGAGDDAPQENKKPLVKLSEGKFVPPAEGTEINKKCPVQVSVEYLDDSAKSMQKVTFSLYANYNDTTSNLNLCVDGYEKDGIAQAEMTMYPPSGYKEGDSVEYFFKAEHIQGEKVIDSEDLTLPMEIKSIILQKGDYDENGASAYNKEQSGDNFKPNNVVKKLQQDLITICFLPKGSDDGFFGDQTDKAVKEFQDYAIKLVRMKRSVGKTENTDKGLDQESPDGIVGEKTRDELDNWLSKDWIKPIPTLRHGEYDDTGVDNGKGKSGTDEHHQGTPVVEVQQNLQKVGLYLNFKIDGWFHDNMLCGVKDFQSAASDATFVVNGKLTLFDQKLTGFRKEELCPATQEYLKMVVDKSGKVPEKIQKATKTSENGIQFIMNHEGFVGKPYNDNFGNATIGYGNLLHMGVVTEADNKKYSNGISKEDARKLLEEKVNDFEKHLNAAVNVELNQNQFDALMSWTYNFGPGRLIESKCTWLCELNNGNYNKVPDNLLSWNKGTKDGKLIELDGLTKRRREEGELFTKSPS